MLTRAYLANRATRFLLIGWLLISCAVRGFAVEEDNVKVDGATEAIIHGALQYLATQQGVDGSWTLGTGNAKPESVAMTGYALLAFLSAGNLPDEGEYGRNVDSGMQFLLSQVQPDGLFRNVDQGKYMYSHGIATIALSELYGQARAPILRGRLEQLVGVIVGGQSPLGGWRYKPEAKDADISITVLQLAALRAAKTAGLEVPQDTIDRAVGYVRKCYNETEGGFGYQPGGKAGFARTAAAIYSLQVSGDYDNPLVMKGSDYLFANVDRDSGYWSYGCYYAGPAQYMIGGDVWQRWYEKMRNTLVSTVTRDGDACYWAPKRSQPMSANYDTAVAITILAMPYHYIPLYQR
jgi:prenyltransferase beta subunit